MARGFDDLLSDPAPAFVCECRDAERQLLVPVAHTVGAPADAVSLRQLPDIPGRSDAEDFFHRHDGAFLFQGPSCFAGPEAVGLLIFPISRWDEMCRDLTDQWSGWGMSTWPAPLAYGPDDVIPIAHQIGAANYVHWVVRGPLAGRVYFWPWTMPAGPDDPPLAPSFGAFLDLVARDPCDLMNELLGCYTRYGDGTSDRQWIPARYVPDKGVVSVDASGFVVP